MDKKRIFLIIGFTLLCIGLGYVMYRIFFKATTDTLPTQPTTQSSTAPVGSNFPVSGAGQPVTTTPIGSGTLPRPSSNQGISGTNQKPQISQLVEDKVVSPHLDANGNVNFYNQFDGKFYRVGKQGSVELLSDKVFFNVQNVTWSPKRNESILEYPDGSNIYYNFETKKQTTLPKHWEEFSFSGDGRSIAAKSIGLAPENRWLVVADPEGTLTTNIEALGENANKVMVQTSPNNQIIALSLTGEALGSERQEVLLVGKNKENFNSLIVEGRGLDPKWSPTGNHLLYSVYSARSNFKPELWITQTSAENIGGERKQLNIQTWANKCAFNDERFIYCGVPVSLDQGAGFEPSIAASTPDRLYKIDTQTGVKSEIQLDSSHTIESLFVGEDGRTLFFTDKTQNGIFEVSI